MADEKRDRNETAEGEQRRQPEREGEGERTRSDEAEPMPGDLDDRLGDLDEALETRDYPVTTDELVEAYGEYELETRGGTEALEEVLASTDGQTYDSADDVRSRILGLIQR